jgi:hypothetical protein
VADPSPVLEICAPLCGMWIEGLGTGMLVGQRRQAEADRARRALQRQAFEEHMLRRRQGGGWSA